MEIGATKAVQDRLKTTKIAEDVYKRQVARRVRECNVYCEIYSYRTDIEQIKAMNPKGIILTGGPNSCYEEMCIRDRKSAMRLALPL